MCVTVGTGAVTGQWPAAHWHWQGQPGQEGCQPATAALPSRLVPVTARVSQTVPVAILHRDCGVTAVRQPVGTDSNVRLDQSPWSETPSRSLRLQDGHWAMSNRAGQACQVGPRLTHSPSPYLSGRHPSTTPQKCNLTCVGAYYNCSITDHFIVFFRSWPPLRNFGQIWRELRQSQGIV